jgi:hypothetical protein
MCVDLLQEVFVLLAGVDRLNSAVPSLRSFQGWHVAHDVSHRRNGAHKYIQASVFQILESEKYGVVSLDLDARLVFLPNVFVAGAAYLNPDALADDSSGLLIGLSGRKAAATPPSKYGSEKSIRCARSGV